MVKTIRVVGIGAAALLIMAGCSMFHRNQNASTGSSGYGSSGTSSYSQGSSGTSGAGQTSSSFSSQNQMASSDSVKQAQEQLKAAGFDPGQIDGRMGPDTQKALKDFQQAKGLPTTGQLDSQTQQELAKAESSGSSGSNAAAGTSSSNTTSNTSTTNKQ